jgi:choline dehydrogenase-like flavoprotein
MAGMIRPCAVKHTSIMPTVVNSNTSSPPMMISENAADLIRKS